MRIFDRTWILDRVFEGRHEQLAIETLKVRTSQVREIEKGPRDAQREKELREVENRIAFAVQQPTGPPFVDDCLTAALLARSLELPRVEVEGRFVRLQQAAEKHGTRHQRVLAFYQHAWTAFWWYEDYSLVRYVYGDVALLALDSPNGADCLS